MERFEVVSFTAKQMNDAGYCGQQGGYITGRHYAIRETGKGLVSLDGGRTVFLMKVEGLFTRMSANDRVVEADR